MNNPVKITQQKCQTWFLIRFFKFTIHEFRIPTRRMDAFLLCLI